MPDHTVYTVAWICAISTELGAAKAFLDEEHDDIDDLAPDDDNTYLLGKIGKLHVVIATLPHGQYGLVSAAIVARDMAHSFPNIRFALMVGIGGGAPSHEHDIRLGDIVVSSPGSGTGGVLQYDFGKTVQDKSFAITGHLNQPPQCLLRAIPFLEAEYESEGNGIDRKINDILKIKLRLRHKYQKPETDTDKLFKSSYKHAGLEKQECSEVCIDTSQLITRKTRDEEDPMIHFGLVASANQVMKDADMRDRLSAEEGVLCFEMESAGLMNHFPCLVIRGICDYSDTHKNKSWQGYAAMAAAAFAKDLLCKVPLRNVEAEKRLSEVIHDVQEQIHGIQTTVMKTEKRAQLDKLRIWLAAPDPSTNFEHSRNLCWKETGQWFLDTEQYSRWKAEKQSFLWLHGIPGCGKTILSSTIIADLERNKNVSTLYFFFDFKDTKKQSLDKAICSLISQLCDKQPSLWTQIDALYTELNNGAKKLDMASLEELFSGMLKQVGDICIILDALDESSRGDGSYSRQALLSWIKRLRDTSANTHVLVTSRLDYDIRVAFEEWAPPDGIIELSSRLMEKDITTYVQAKVAELERWRNREDIRQEIEHALLKKADGMFLWVACQLETLQSCKNPAAVRTALKDLPSTLEETYKRILERIPRHDKNTATRLLQILLYTRRPLSLQEAVDFIAVDLSSRPGFFIENRMPVPEEIIEYCPHLVVITRRTVRDDRYARTRIKSITEVQLAHLSVEEYLMSEQPEEELARELEEIRAKISIVDVCIHYLLSLYELCSGDEAFPEYALARYAAKYWVIYAQDIEKVRKSALPSIREYYSCRKAFQYGYQTLLCKEERPWQIHDVSIEALQFAALNGLFYSCMDLLDRGADVNAQSGLYGNALQAALHGGHLELAKGLLERGANVNAQGGNYGTAIQAASTQGHLEFANMLLEKGASINTITQGREHSTALLAALDNRHLDTAKMLLNEGADANAQDQEHASALYHASERGYLELSKLLLDKGSNINAQGGLYGNALQSASVFGGLEVAQMLVDRGADINAQGGYYGNALQAASAKGHPKVTRMLLENGADINAHGGRYSNALEAALAEGLPGLLWTDGHREVAQILIEAGADISEPKGGQALIAASEKGDFRLAKLLVDKGVDINAQDFCHRTAFHTALNEGHQEIARMLIDKGVDIQGSSSGDALQSASSVGDLELAQILLDKGASVDAQGGFYGNALQAASSVGHLELVQVLLSHGSNVNAQGGHYGNALQAASARSGNSELVQVFLDNGANVNAQGGEYGNALQAATANRHLEIAKMLLYRGADINLQGGKYGNALYAALEEGLPRLAEILLDKGADVNAESGEGGNILQSALANGHLEIAKVLLNKGADVNAGGKYGTAIHAALLHMKREIINNLDTYAKDAQHSVECRAALERNVRDTIDMLIKKGADVNARKEHSSSALSEASKNGYISIAELLLDKGADINEQDGWYGSALIAASSQRQLEVAIMLVKRGADINSQQRIYGSALIAASEVGSIQIAEMLLDKGADINAQVGGGRHGNALEAASANRHLELAKYLIEKGADVNAQGGRYRNALHAALANGHLEIADMLLDNGAIRDVVE
ncbi:unnamed protein product [Clonostachys rosea]|uniref:NACHT domain-containing protein n=1 Tax=Bionectria ochroleuca TaxID=29856 RepID=A0ABY6U6E3_BIOOC|nr:unnamed protein product [Clonostachys rosea]